MDWRLERIVDTHTRSLSSSRCPNGVRITLPCPKLKDDDPTLRACAPLPAVPTDFGLILRTGSGPGSASVCPCIYIYKYIYI